ncbi:MAG TPA: sigma-70 family RNA polymerase sigma factor [Solirubrobacteraceae bacterium]|nr:sigma-70 family RNA polymerase sigma factor [Solirubrobacteraceae bacterium]
MPTTPALAPLALDVAELYRAQSTRLEQIVRLDVRAPEPVVQDACQVAWSRLLRHAGQVRPDTALAWLATTAVREARRLNRRERRELSLEAEADLCRTAAPGPDELAARRERLGLIASLPERQQRLVWLHAFGLSYAEMASSTGCTVRTVERQLLRAKARLRALAAT